MKLFPFILLLWFAGIASLASGQFLQPRPQVQAHLNFSSLHPGQQAVMAVVVDIPDGLHSQSNTPSNPDFIPFVIELSENPHVRFYPVIYPEGRDVTYPALGLLNVYDGRVIAFVPLEIKPDAPPGELILSARLQIQLCDDSTCFQPLMGNRAIPIQITTQIVDHAQAITSANELFFADFDPRAFIQPAMPATRLNLFGWFFSLEHSSYFPAFLIAFTVGILFNLMPCVLPVLPLKAIGFYEASQHSRGKCFLLGAIFCLGMLSMFGILAFLIIISGKAWGELFAYGWFVWSIVAVLVVLAIGQLGAFSIMLPNSVYSYVPSHTSYMGNYLFGGFTAILSTPCTAPMFLGLLLWAVGQPNWLGVMTIMTVGAGMALPYLILASFPSLARKIPRSGPWSELVKQYMAFLLLAVAAWFAAGRLISGNDYMWIVTGMVIIGCLFLLIRTIQLSPTIKGVGISAGIGVVLTSAMLYFTLMLTGAVHTLIAWKPFTQEVFEQAIGSGQIVMLEFTANWCANCKELEARVFTDRRTADAVERLSVITIRADLTHSDAPGWDKLRKISEAGGIPLTMIYSPELNEPIALSSIYTTENLISALNRAAGDQLAAQ